MKNLKKKVNNIFYIFLLILSIGVVSPVNSYESQTGNICEIGQPQNC